MNNYTIYCTKDQTKKALELGAPIEYELENPINYETLEREPYVVPRMGEDGEPILVATTAEQMIEWLEEQEEIDSIEISLNKNWEYFIADYYGELNMFRIGFYSRKEATLAAIDRALEYLSNNKK